MSGLLILAPALAVAAGALIIFISSRLTIVARPIALLATAAALASSALPIVMEVGPDPQYIWIPGPETATLLFATKLDWLATLFLLLVNGLALCLTFAGPAITPRGRAAELAAFAAANVVVLASSSSLAAVAVLALGLALAGRQLADSGHEDAMGPLLAPVLTGIALFASAALGPNTAAGFFALALGAIALGGQYPVTWLVRDEQAVDVRVLHLATITVLGGYLVLRYAAPVAPAWGQLLLGVSGVITTVTAGILAVREPVARKSVTLIGAGQIGVFLMALGEQTPVTLTAGLLHLLGVLPLLAGLLLLVGRLEQVAGADELADMAGLARRAPGTAALLVLLAGGIIALPILNASFIAKLILFGAAISEGRALFIAFGWLGSLLAALALARLLFPLYARETLIEEAPAGGRRTALVAMLLFAGSLLLGALSWTPFDPVSRATIGLLGVGRERPIAAEIISAPIIATAASAAGMLVAVLLGIVIAWRAGRSLVPKEVPIIDRERALVLARVEREGRLVLRSNLPSLATSGGSEPPILSAALDPRPVEAFVWRLLRGTAWLIVSGLAALEGRYYLAAVLVAGLWIAIVFMG